MQAAVVTTLLKSLQPPSDIDQCLVTLAYSLGDFQCLLYCMLCDQLLAWVTAVFPVHIRRYMS